MMTKLKTIDFKGKPYVEVNERIRYFRECEDYINWALISEFIEINDKWCVIKGSILNPEGVVKATGMAREQNGDSFINKTSYVENCETSAWGRALGNLGIGIDGSVASAEEVKNAVKQQGNKNNTADEPKKPKYDNEEAVSIVIKAINACNTQDELAVAEARFNDLTKPYFIKKKQEQHNETILQALDNRAKEIG
jgi:hypothetical protein